MSWRMYKVVFRIRTPIHIGYRKYGNLMQTRSYIPARVLLGALTSCITREIFGQARDWKQYRIVGEILNRIFTTSYFYPTTEENGQIDMFPWDENFPHYDFIGSYVSTALESGGKSVQEGSLHEVEYISPRTRYGGKQVYLCGYFFIREMQNICNIFREIRENLEIEHRKSNLSCGEIGELLNLFQSNDRRIAEITERIIKEWGNLTETLQIGGERGYGWGIVEKTHIGEDSSRMFGKYAIDLAEDRPVVEIPEGESVPAHLIIGENDLRISGEIEPLVRKEWRENPGSSVIFDGVAYKPGVKVSANVRLSVGNLGYYRIKRCQTHSRE